MFLGNEKDCICDKPNGKHREYCDAFRLSEIMKQSAGYKIVKEDSNGTED